MRRKWQERFDPTYATYTSGLGSYDDLSRLGVPGVFDSVAAVATTAKIKKPLITVAGTMDALLPIVRQAHAYEAKVGASRKGTTTSGGPSTGSTRCITAITSRASSRPSRSCK